MQDFTAIGKKSLYDPSDCPDLTHDSDMSFGDEQPVLGEVAVGGNVSGFDFDLDLQANNISGMTQDTPGSQTISPQDLLLNEDLFPGSTPSSYLQTPRTDFDSPDTFIPASPFMDSKGEFPSGNEPVANHFHSFEQLETALHADTLLSSQAPRSSDTKGAVSINPTAVPMSRAGSSTSKRPSMTGARINKRGRGPLPEIEVDQHDVVAMKRSRNTMAARKSRAKRQAHVEALEDENERLMRELEFWKGAAEHCADPDKFKAFEHMYNSQAE